MKLKLLLTISLIFVAFISEEIYSQTFETGKIAISMSTYGRIRVTKDSLAGVRQVDRSTFLAGVDPSFVFSYKLSAEPEDTMISVLNPLISDFEIAGSINNSYDTTGGSPDFLVQHNVYGWSGKGYVLVKFTVKNRETTTQETILGMEIIPQVDGSYGLESVEYLSDSKIISMYRLPTSAYTGYKLLSHNMTTLKSIEWYSGYNDVNADLFAWLSYGQIDTLYEAGGDGAVSFFSKDAVDIPSGQDEIFWVGISVGANEAEMVARMEEAKTKYESLTSILDDASVVPSDYLLQQNYPNPFNPATTIQFQLPKTDFVTLKIYDIIGNEIAVPVNNLLEAGTHRIQFDGSSLSSGVYFYRISTGSFSETKKMTLIK